MIGDQLVLPEISGFGIIDPPENTVSRRKPVPPERRSHGFSGLATDAGLFLPFCHPIRNRGHDRALPGLPIETVAITR